MANLTTYAANELLDGTPIPATLYAQLHVGDPTPAGTADVAAETARKAFTRTAATGGAAANAALIEWVNATADEDISHVTAWDAASGGNPWIVAAVTGGPVSVEAGNTIQIDAGEFALTATIWT